MINLTKEYLKNVYGISDKVIKLYEQAIDDVNEEF